MINAVDWHCIHEWPIPDHFHPMTMSPDGNLVQLQQIDFIKFSHLLSADCYIMDINSGLIILRFRTRRLGFFSPDSQRYCPYPHHAVISMQGLLQPGPVFMLYATVMDQPIDTGAHH